MSNVAPANAVVTNKKNFRPPEVSLSKQSSKDSAQSDSDDSESEYLDPEILKKKMQSQAKKNPRSSVSAEVYGKFNKKEAYVPKVVPKTALQKAKIRERLGQAFMFSALDPKEKTIVIDAMEILTVQPGEVVIKQGDPGDKLFVVDQGRLDCSKLFSGDTVDKFLKTYEPGESFGELALLYNAPRAASIVAKEKSTLFSLDRECFNSIVKDSAIKKREKYLAFLEKVDIFKGLDTYDRSKICDCFLSQSFQPGEYIIRQVSIILTQGEHGNSFFLVIEGQGYAAKKNDQGAEEKVFDYEPMGYFGELALLKGAPRAASVIAKVNELADSRLK